MEQTANQFLGRKPVGKPMKKYAVPCIISMIKVLKSLFTPNLSGAKRILMSFIGNMA